MGLKDPGRMSSFCIIAVVMLEHFLGIRIAAALKRGKNPGLSSLKLRCLDDLCMSLCFFCWILITGDTLVCQHFGTCSSLESEHEREGILR